MVFVEGETKHTVRNANPKVDRERFCINDEDALELADYAIMIERHYGRPMDMEAKDGLDGQLYLLQACPRDRGLQRVHHPGDLLAPGRRAEVLAEALRGREDRDGPSPSDRERQPAVRVRGGEVLVSDITTPDWEPVMKQAAAIVTNRGGRTCHAAIIARELGVPAVVGSGDGTTRSPAGRRSPSRAPRAIRDASTAARCPRPTAPRWRRWSVPPPRS